MSISARLASKLVFGFVHIYINVYVQSMWRNIQVDGDFFAAWESLQRLDVSYGFHCDANGTFPSTLKKLIYLVNLFLQILYGPITLLIAITYSN